MKLSLKIPQQLFVTAIVVFAALNSYLIVKEIYYQLLIPLLVVVGYFALNKPNLLLLFVGLAAPFSLNLNKIKGLEGLGIYFPTEPILIGLSLLLLIGSVKTKILDPKIHSHRVSWAVYFMLFWLFVTTCTSSMPVVSIKFFVSRIWFIIPLYFMASHLFQKTEFIKKYFNLYILGLTAVIIITLIHHSQYGFTQEAGHWVMNPYYKDHTSYGAVIALLFPMIVGYSFTKTSGKIPMNVYRLVLLIFTVGLIFSFTRAAWLSLV